MLSEIATRVMRDKNEKIATLESEVKRLKVSLDEYVRLDRMGLVSYDKHQPEVPDARCDALTADEDSHK